MVLYKLKQYEWNGLEYDEVLKHQTRHLEKIMKVGKSLLEKGYDSIRILKMEPDEYGELTSTFTYDDIDIKEFKI